MILPAIAARPTPMCQLCVRGYALIHADLEELYPVLRRPRAERDRYTELHGHGFTTPRLILDATSHCAECHAVGERS
jgi:hypothetical protein